MNAQETILEFYLESDTNEALRTALDAATSADQVVAVAREYGYAFTKDDMAALREQLNVLNDSEMEDLSGGTLSTGTYAGYYRLSDAGRQRLNSGSLF